MNNQQEQGEPLNSNDVFSQDFPSLDQINQGSTKSKTSKSKGKSKASGSKKLKDGEKKTEDLKGALTELDKANNETELTPEATTENSQDPTPESMEDNSKNVQGKISTQKNDSSTGAKPAKQKKNDSKQKGGATKPNEETFPTLASGATKKKSKFSQLKLLTVNPKNVEVFHFRDAKLNQEVTFEELKNYNMVLQDKANKFLVAHSNEEVTVLENNQGNVTVYYTQPIRNSKHFWFSRTERFLCVIHKPDRNYLLTVFDLTKKSTVSFHTP